MDCLFCKIIDGEIPSNKVYEDDMMLKHSVTSIRKHRSTLLLCLSVTLQVRMKLMQKT